MAISDWPARERPRERLLDLGPHALTDAELLAIFLRTGCKGKSAVDLARDLLTSFGGLRPLLNATQEQFCHAQGLGPAKFSQLQAVVEMARRHLLESIDDQQTLSDSTTVRQFLRAQLRDKQQEVFSALFLNAQHQLIRYEELFHGTLDSAAVYPREVLKRSLSYNAGAVIFAHNHPSGISEPSQADIAITRTLKEALALVDIRTLDHVIIGDTQTTSLAELGLL